MRAGPVSCYVCSTDAFVLDTPSRRGDHTSGSGKPWFTAVITARGTDGVDDGTCVIESPMPPVDEDSNLSLWYFQGQKDSGDDDGDFFALHISTDGGSTFTPLVSIGNKRINRSRHTILDGPISNSEL